MLAAYALPPPRERGEGGRREPAGWGTFLSRGERAAHLRTPDLIGGSQVRTVRAYERSQGKIPSPARFARDLSPWERYSCRASAPSSPRPRPHLNLDAAGERRVAGARLEGLDGMNPPPLHILG